MIVLLLSLFLKVLTVDKKPIENAEIYIVPGNIYAFTDTLGECYLEVDSLPAKIRINRIGFRDTTFIINSFRGETLYVFLKRTVIQIKGITLRGEPIRTVSSITMGETLKHLPMGDENYMVNVGNTAGAVKATEALGTFYLLGGDINENIFLLDNVPVPFPFHFLGVLPLFPVEAVKYVEIIPVSPSVDYGDIISGVIKIGLREPGLTPTAFKLGVDGIKISHSINSNRMKGSLFFRSGFPYLYPPFYTFLTLLSNKSGSISFTGYSSKEEVFLPIELFSFDMENPGEVSHQNGVIFNLKTSHAGLSIYGIQLLQKVGFYESDGTQIDRLEDIFSEDVGIKTGINIKHLSGGIQVSRQRIKLKIDNPLVPLLSGYLFTPNLMVDTTLYRAGLWGETTLEPFNGIKMVMGIRYSYRSIEQSFIRSVHLHINYETSWGDFFIKWGDYQDFVPLEYVEKIPDGYFVQSKHYVLGLRKSLKTGLSTRFFLFDKEFLKTPCYYKDKFYQGNGYSRGGLFSFEFIKGPLQFNGGICISKAKRTGDYDTTYTRFRGDVPFSFNLNGIYNVKNTTFSFTYVWSSGRPYTPVIGYERNDYDYYYIWGKYNSEILPPYSRLDLKVSFRIKKLGIGFTLINLMNNKNISFYIYDFPYRYAVCVFPRMFLLTLQFPY